MMLKIVGASISFVTLTLISFPLSAQKRSMPGQASFLVQRECRQIEKMGDPTIADCNVACPVGSLRSQGGCETTGARPWAIRKSLSTDNGWSCSAYDPLSVGNGNAVPQRDVRLKVSATCVSQGVSTSSVWKLPAAGNIIAIARAGAGLTRQIPLSFSICNSGPSTVTVLVYRKTEGTPGYELIDPRPELPTGKCLIVDKLTAVYLANYESQTVGAEGSYQAFPSEYFGLGKEAYRIVDAPQSVVSSSEQQGELRVLLCKPVKGANPKINVYSICTVRNLEWGANYRVCLDKTYTAPQNNQNYPGTLAPMILDSRLRERASSNQEILWNPIAAESCRDIYGWRYGAILVNPWRTNPNDRTWQPEKVDKISIRVERLP